MADRHDPARARRYDGFFDGSNQAEIIFTALLPVVTTFVNGRLAARGAKAPLTKAEIGINFITEGGYYTLQNNNFVSLMGFVDGGVDDYLAHRAEYRNWVPPDVDALADDPDHLFLTVNEQGREVTSLNGMTLRQGLHLSGGVLGYSSWSAERAIGGFASLPLEGKFFWRTVFFNAGAPLARSIYAKHGVDAYQHKWSGGSLMQPLFNATWRTASLMLLLSQLTAELRPELVRTRKPQ